MLDGIKHLLSNWDDMLAGATLWAIFGHAVNSFPVPVNKYGQWLLSTVQFSVGQRNRAANTFNGADTLTSAIPKTGTGDGRVDRATNSV